MPESSTATAVPAGALGALVPTADAMPTDFGAVYEAHARAIYYLALRLLGDPARAEDAAHDVFLKAFRNLAGFRHESAVRTWLYRITINHCRNLRQTWHQRNIQLTANGSFAENTVEDDRSPFRVAAANDLGRQIQKSLDAIPEEYRLLILLVADEEMSYEQIAELTQQTCDSVRGKLYRARKAFAAAFKQTA
jgi:RNA polymerase sigma-70 factor (ECF subfamily)